MRGEQAVLTNIRAIITGSSPHAWGTDRKPAFLNFPRRFIPTCVGNSKALKFHDEASAVHPHMRGEQGNGKTDALLMDGSSPHAWGTVKLVLAVSSFDRFIPTCVGNSKG